MRALYDLRDCVFFSKYESFFWNLNECVEPKTKDHRCDAGLNEYSDDDSGDEDLHASNLRGYATLEDRGQSKTNVSYEI